MGMVKKVLDWTEKKTEEVDIENDKHPYLKAFGLGVIEGAIDGAVIMYPILVGTLFYVGYKLEKKGINLKD